jgi:hypothetical protein
MGILDARFEVFMAVKIQVEVTYPADLDVKRTNYQEMRNDRVQCN